MPWSGSRISTKPVFPVKVSKIQFDLISYPHDTPGNHWRRFDWLSFGVNSLRRIGSKAVWGRHIFGWQWQPGATNVLREVGKPAGYTVFVFDFLKGFLATYWFMIPVFPFRVILSFWGCGVCPPLSLGTPIPCLPVFGVERAWLRQWAVCLE